MCNYGALNSLFYLHLLINQCFKAPNFHILEAFQTFNCNLDSNVKTDFKI